MLFKYLKCSAVRASSAVGVGEHFEKAWSAIHSEGIQKLQDFLDCGQEVQFTNEEKSRLYT